MENTIELLCEKFGVTANYLVDELFRYHTTIDWISLIIWFFVIVITIVISIKYKTKWIESSKRGDWFTMAIGIPVTVIVAAIISIPLIIVDLVGWYVSPIGSTLTIIIQ